MGIPLFLVDITDYLNDLNQDNIVAVRVDRTRYADSRWYTGSGIYRKVTLNILDKVHIPIWGTYFTTPQLDKNKATVHGQIAVNNETLERKSIELRLTVFAPNGEVVHQSSHKKLLYPRQHETLDLQWEIDHPLLWEIHHARLYTIRTELYVEQKKIQEETTKIGLRSFRFDVNKGFFFNGVHTLIKGVCLHHCAGLVGAAVPLDVWRRRLERLKECGCNAIRTAHNPPSEDFLNLCDEMGFLVQEEFFDEWDYPKDKRFNGTEQKVDYITRGHAEFFRETAQEDLQNSMRRDRNHPCIFQWSIGNEIEWTYPKYNKATGYFGADATGNYFWTLPPYDIKTIRENIRKLPEDPYEIGKTAHKLAKWVKELDVTRPVIANCILPSASYESGYTDALDIVGYSYRQVVYEYGHKNYPEKPIMGTENVPQWHEWKQVLEKEYVPGIFLWTGVDYLGEAGAKNPWPKKVLIMDYWIMRDFANLLITCLKAYGQTSPLFIWSLRRLKNLYMC
jgi:beta-galactosidase